MYDCLIISPKSVMKQLVDVNCVRRPQNVHSKEVLLNAKYLRKKQSFLFEHSVNVKQSLTR